MKTVEVEYTVDGIKQEATYRTNNSGSYLFRGVSENKQVSCEEGLDSQIAMRKAIRRHIVERNFTSTVSRIKYDWTRF